VVGATGVVALPLKLLVPVRSRFSRLSSYFVQTAALCSKMPFSARVEYEAISTSPSAPGDDAGANERNVFC